MEVGFPAGFRQCGLKELHSFFFAEFAFKPAEFPGEGFEREMRSRWGQFAGLPDHHSAIGADIDCVRVSMQVTAQDRIGVGIVLRGREKPFQEGLFTMSQEVRDHSTWTSLGKPVSDPVGPIPVHFFQ